MNGYKGHSLTNEESPYGEYYKNLLSDSNFNFTSYTCNVLILFTTPCWGVLLQY